MVADYDPIDLASQEEAKAEAAKIRDEEQGQANLDFKWLMSDERGRRFMWELLTECRVYHDPMTGNSQTFYNLGQQRVGRWLIERLHTVCLELKHVMELERRKDG